MDEIITRLKEYAKAIQVREDWEYNEKYTDEEYQQLSAKWFGYNTHEITEELLKYINSL
mgnify:CR=1 FL=1|jgi:hypothetical protein